MIEWIVFDLGGVVVDVDYAVLFNSLVAESGLSLDRVKQIYRENCYHDLDNLSLVDHYQMGQISTQQFLNQVCHAVEHRVTPEQVTMAWKAMIKEEFPETLALIRQLAKRYQLACFSNINELHWQCLLDKDFECMCYFQVQIVSHLLKAIKPQPQGFAAAVQKLQAKPEQCLLVDDRQSNVEGARAAGWQALQFENAQQLEKYVTF